MTDVVSEQQRRDIAPMSSNSLPGALPGRWRVLPRERDSSLNAHLALNDHALVPVSQALTGELSGADASPAAKEEPQCRLLASSDLIDDERQEAGPIPDGTGSVRYGGAGRGSRDPCTGIDSTSGNPCVGRQIHGHQSGESGRRCHGGCRHQFQRSDHGSLVSPSRRT